MVTPPSPPPPPLLVKAGSGLLTGAVPDSAGVPKGYAENTLLARYNDAESVRALFAANSGKIACVVYETEPWLHESIYSEGDWKFLN